MSTGRSANEGRVGCRKVLVVDLGFLGDTIHLVPALWELRRHHAGAELHVVTTPVGCEVLALAPWVDRVWTMPLGAPSPPWWRHLDLQWRLWREGFDRVVNFSGADRTLFVAGFTGVRDRLTRETARKGIWRRLLRGRSIPAPARSQPVYEQRRQVLAGAGYALEPARFELRIPNEAREWAGTMLGDGLAAPGDGRGVGGAGDWVHVSINASSPFKEWPLDRWVTWIARFLGEGRGRVLATGSAKERERERLRALAEGVGDGGLRIVTEGLTIARLAALVARCRLHVGTDSGVTHLAMALGLPTVSVFREYAGLEEWRPAGLGHVALTSPCGCVDQPSMLPGCVAAGTAVCLSKIGVDTVMAGVERVWGKGARQNGW